VAACGIVMLLPNGTLISQVKLMIATWGTLILPGAVILRLIGWPRSLLAALPACAAWSLTALAPGFMLMLVIGQGLVVAVSWLLLVIAVGLVLGRGKPVEMEIRPLPLLLFGGGVALFSLYLWMGSWNNIGDAVEHIARMRKITELDPPARHLDELGILPPDTGLHPGYAFPLWHASGGVIVWLSHLEETFMFRYWPTALVPFVAAAVYRAGREMFGCWPAGVATCVAYLGVFAFPFGAGFFAQISYPGYIAIFLFWPLVIERTFVFLREGGWEPPLTAAAASFVVTAIHPSYTPFMILLIGAFLVAQTLVRRRDDVRRSTIALGAVTVPFLLFLVWLYPAAKSASATVKGGANHFGSLVDSHGDLVNMKAGWVTRGGAVAVAALLFVPLASAATRTRAAAFVASASTVVILTLIVPYFFTPFAHVMSISQGRRFLFYLPFAFALTGGALVLARFRYYAVAGAFALGLGLYLIWPGEATYVLQHPGPSWLAWFAGIAGLVVFAVGATRRLNLRYGNVWGLAIVVALVLPTAVTGAHDMVRFKGAPHEFSTGVLNAVDTYVSSDDVVLALPKVGYRLSDRAPIYLMASTGGHGGNTTVNDQGDRRKAAVDFFDFDTTPAEAQAIVEKWDVQWVLVRKDFPQWSWPREYLDRFQPVYEDKRYALYAVDPSLQPRIDALEREQSSG
jgi:hypothetical protein